MSIIEKGRQEAEELEREHEERQERWREQTHQRVIRDFWQTFYKDRIIRNPEFTGLGSKPRLIWDPDNMPPEIHNWELLPNQPSSQGDSTFLCEGIRYICRWKYHGGGDRAYWDDGWWPDWFVVVERPRFFGLLRRREEIKVNGAASVAEAIES